MPSLYRRGANGYPFSNFELWADPSDPVVFNGMSDVEIQVIGTPGGPLTPQRSANGTDYANSYAYDKDSAPNSTITGPGFYSLEGGCHLKLTGTLAPAVIYFRAGV